MQKDVTNKKLLCYVINHFRTGAVPNILLEVIPFIKERYKLRVLSLQPIVTNDPVVVKFKDLGIYVDSLNLSKLDTFQCYSKLRKYFKVHEPEVIHSNFGRADFWSALCKPRNSKLITTFHSVRSNYSVLTRAGYRVVDRLVDERTSVSKTVKNSWQDSTKINIHTIYNPVNVCNFSAYLSASKEVKQELGITPTDRVILNVGNLRRQKGQIHLVRAMPKVLELRQDTCLVLVGRLSESATNLKRAALELGIEKKVHFVGFRHDIPRILSIADVFAFPSETEGLGIAVLEAMAAKVPVIASDLPAIAEYIDDGINGLLFPVKDDDALAECILSILENPDRHRQLSQNAYETVQKLFNPRAIAESYMRLY